jgi:PEP-CTERM motif-containing protein
VLAVVFSSSAHAQLLDFNFSFSNVTGNTDGTVTGEIIGLNSTGTSTPTDIIITSAPLALEIDTPADINTYPYPTITGSFTVSSDAISGGSLLASYVSGYDTLASLRLNGSNTYNSLGLIYAGEPPITGNDGGFSGATYTYAGIDNVPEPSTYALLLFGAAALFAGRRFLGSKHSV